MNILFLSQVAMDKKNSFGNTICNWFEGNAWKNDEFYHFYTRRQEPENGMNIDYYNLTDVDVVKGALKFKIQGKEFSIDGVNFVKSEKESQDKEKLQIDKIQHMKNNQFIYFAHEQIWKSELWLNRYFKLFVEKVNPDVLFAFAIDQYILWPLIKYLKNNTNCKIVLFISDDVYGAIDNNTWYRRTYLKKEFKKCIEYADKLYAVSEEMCGLYQNRFNKPVEVLYKGCDLSNELKGCLNNPLRIVYAGNLYYGRDDTLAKLAKAIEKVNSSKQVAQLEIYTGATINSQLEEKLNIEGSSKIMGKRSYDEIKEIMRNADIVLHVESFEKAQKELVKYSFSTKIIDCLQSGNAVLGIGPANIASIEYLRKTDGAFVIDSIEKIDTEVERIVCDTNALRKSAFQTRDFAERNHELSVVREKLRKELVDLCK